MMLKRLITLLLLYTSIGLQAQDKMVLIELKPYDEVYINVDGKPYYTTYSCTIIPEIERGKHELLVIDKHTGKQNLLELNILQLPSYFKLIKSLTGYKLLQQEVSTESYSKYIENITVQADSISVEEPQPKVDCIAYNETEMDFIRRKYIQSSDKSSYLKAAFEGKCVTQHQLQELLLASLTVKDRYTVLHTLYRQIYPQLDMEQVSSFFEDTDYFSDFLKLKSQFEGQ